MESTLIGGAAKVMNVDTLGEKGTPWHFWEDKRRLAGAPKKSLSNNMKFAVTPPVLTPVVPVRMPSNGSCVKGNFDSCTTPRKSEVAHTLPTNEMGTPDPN